MPLMLLTFVTSALLGVVSSFGSSAATAASRCASAGPSGSSHVVVLLPAAAASSTPLEASGRRCLRCECRRCPSSSSRGASLACGSARFSKHHSWARMASAVTSFAERCRPWPKGFGSLEEMPADKLAARRGSRSSWLRRQQQQQRHLGRRLTRSQSVLDAISRDKKLRL